MIGKLLGGIVRVANTPAEAVERLFEDDLKKPKDRDRTISAPLESVAKTLDDIDQKQEGE